MTWQIQIPFRECSESLTSAGELANRLDADEDCAVAHQLRDVGRDGGFATAGELVDRIVGRTKGKP